ncbi:hypothetical protein P153DRAFT_367100 [Dothidotthia symphoricarpi CBS 119687]|uniref:MARVEL domain-containing protein n=1 Tax=Dothidotthia symphoricarpi CBS 119687 TaxID=1392245 RepID=A0A6A6ACN5_9PLEO|nr:uncharacterized protein P153DRAFT_367100 [Dothidotthia symphoricarpi CBS 119687]KAF2128744.1 hypothetical protein P153DRAFT_367100 [Dothidotthia symphoricarpi CBS 119687]
MENNAAEVLLADRRQTQERSSAPDLRQYRGFHWTRLVLRVLSLSTCAAISVVLIDAIYTYNKTKHVRNPYRGGSGTFPVWPKDLKLYPTYILLGAAAFAGVFSLLLVVASFTKKVRRMTQTGNVATVVISSVCLVVWVVVTAYYGTWDTSETNWDLLSWTCQHRNPEYRYQDINFGEICTEMRFAFWAGVGLAVMEAFNLAIFILWFIKTRHSRGYEQMQSGNGERGFHLTPTSNGSRLLSEERGP